MSEKNIKLVYGYDYYKDPSCVDIKELARSLGIKISHGRIQCPCPDHADKNPSTQISSDGRYANQWKCYSCNASGGPIELVVAVNSKVSPDEYWRMVKSDDPKEREKGIKLRNEAIQYIDELFPGNIEEEEATAEKDHDEKVKFPKIPKEIYTLIGIKNPRVPSIVKYPIGQSEDGEVKTASSYFKLSDQEAADMILGSMLSYQDNLKKRMLGIFKDYPEIDMKSKVYIANRTNEMADVLSPYINSLRAYLKLPISMDKEGEEDELEI